VGACGTLDISLFIAASLSSPFTWIGQVKFAAPYSGPVQLSILIFGDLRMSVFELGFGLHEYGMLRSRRIELRSTILTEQTSDNDSQPMNSRPALHHETASAVQHIHDRRHFLFSSGCSSNLGGKMMSYGCHALISSPRLVRESENNHLGRASRWRSSLRMTFSCRWRRS
jgi:hypothetical protein